MYVIPGSKSKCMSRQHSKFPVKTCKIWVKFGLQYRMLLLLSRPVCIYKQRERGCKILVKISGQQACHNNLSKMCLESICTGCCLSHFVMCIYSDLRFQQPESVPPISYRVDREASRAWHKEGEGLGSEETGGQLVLLHIHFCLFFISGFPINLTVINRQQVALFLFFV